MRVHAIARTCMPPCRHADGAAEAAAAALIIAGADVHALAVLLMPSLAIARATLPEPIIADRSAARKEAAAMVLC